MSNIPPKKGVDIGGQAVMEGVMMKSPDAIAITVRRPDGSMAVRYEPYESPAKKHKWMGLPFIRGIINLGTMMSLGMRTLQTSTEMLGQAEEEPTRFELWLSKKLGKGVDKVVMGVAVVLAIVLSVGLFVLIPSIIATVLRSTGMGRIPVNLISGLVRIALLMGYMILCAKVPDVRRTFQYHGAEHKTVYCHEAGLPLTPGNADTFITLHPRCGTSFLLIVFIIAMLLFTFVGYNGTNALLRFLSNLALLPVVAGVSYEVLKYLAHHDGWLIRALRFPGMQMQRLTTRPPDESMLECAIVSMNVALYGMPEGAQLDDRQCWIIRDYRLSEQKVIEGAAAAV